MVVIHIINIPQKVELENLINSNMTRQEIAENYKCSPSTVSSWFKKYNLKSKRIGGANNIKDLIGNRYGNLTVVSLYKIGKHGKEYLCNCDCGNQTIQRGSSLTGGNVISCGCIRNEKVRKSGKNNLTHYYKDIYDKNIHLNEMKSHIGEKYNKLTIIDCKPNNRKNQRGYIMICRCDCGNISRQVYSDLTSGNVKSCGCYQKEQASKTGSTVGLNNYKNGYQWYFIKDEKKINCRSGYEVIYANYLIQNNINFEYESKCFKLDNGKRYTPDFYLIDTDEYIEIKGSFNMNNSHQKENAKLFSETHNYRILYWNDIVDELHLKLKTYHSYLRRAEKLCISKEDYLADFTNYYRKEEVIEN